IQMTGGQLALAKLNTTLPELTGTYTLSGGRIILYGSGNQTLRQMPSGGSTPYYQLAFAGSGVKTLSSGITQVANYLLLNTTGYVDAGASDILYVTNNATSSVFRNNGHVVGKLRRNIIGTGIYEFNVGSTTAHQLASVRITSALSASHLTAEYFNSVSGTAGLPITEGAKIWSELNTTGYWDITPNMPLSSGTYDLLLTPVGFGLPSVGNFTIGKRDNGLSPWVLGSTYAPGTATVAERTGYTSFSQFGILTVNIPLPVEMSLLKARPATDAIQLSWDVFREQNNAGWELERMEQTEPFQPITWITGRQNTTEPKTYQYLDSQVRKNVLYTYRLKQVDLDGRISYSNQAEAMLTETGSVVIYPNPVGSDVQIQLPSSVESVELINTLGQIVMELPTNQTVIHTKTEHLPAGIYYLRMLINGVQKSFRIVKQ
ncbi:MAG: T9SS type A sorting domain-containing protein, partial [Bacteroidia bacterium]|nr:T9SS type A sorting domain-containing protein [Bacteroidia bacterium]